MISDIKSSALTVNLRTSRCPFERSPKTYSTFGLIAEGLTVIFQVAFGKSNEYSTFESLKVSLWANAETVKNKPRTAETRNENLFRLHNFYFLWVKLPDIITNFTENFDFLDVFQTVVRCLLLIRKAEART